MSKSFEEWKESCRAELYRIQSACCVTGPSGREESIMSESGVARRNMLMALLTIADKGKSAKETLALIDGKHKDDPAINIDQAKPFVEDLRKVAQAPFEAWKESLQLEFNKLTAMRRSLDCRGREKISVLLTFLNIADWSESAQEVIDWIDGKNILSEEHVMNLRRAAAEPILRDIRRIAEMEVE